MPEIRWVFFDMGGVLVDDEELHEGMVVAIHRILQKHGVCITLEKVRTSFIDYFVHVRGAMASGFIRKYLDSEDKASDAIEEFKRVVYPMFPRLYTVKKEVYSILDELKQIYRLGIIANQPPNMREYLRKNDLETRFEIIILSGEVGITKPDTRIFEIALSKAMCPASGCVMIGDRLDADVSPSKKLGMKTIRLRRGLFSEQQPSSPDEVPDVEVDSIEQIPSALKRLAEM